MNDTEKVIKGLDSCAKWMGKNDGNACDNCPYHSHFSYDDNDCIATVNNDAIALLKEQEAKIGHWIDTTQTIGFPRCKCSVCNSEAGAIWMHYCPICGVKMKQEGR